MVLAIAVALMATLLVACNPDAIDAAGKDAATLVRDDHDLPAFDLKAKAEQIHLNAIATDGAVQAVSHHASLLTDVDTTAIRKYVEDAFCMAVDIVITDDRYPNGNDLAPFVGNEAINSVLRETPSMIESDIVDDLKSELKAAGSNDSKAAYLEQVKLACDIRDALPPG